MKTLIVYYSLEGNTQWAAEKIAARIGADTLRLVPKAAYPDKGFKKFLFGGKSAVMKESPELEPYEVDITQYTQVVLATPVWAGTMAPPLRTFVQREDLSGKRLALVASSMGGSPGKTFSNLKSMLGVAEDIPTLCLKDPKSHPSQANEDALSAFCDKLT